MQTAAAVEFPVALPADPCAVSEAQLEYVMDYAIKAFEAMRSSHRRPLMSSWGALQSYLRLDMGQRGRECFRVLFLDVKNRLISDEVMNEGSIAHAPVYPREVVRRALELDAKNVILVHNHPSGDPTPSEPDVQMTRQIIDACRVLEIAVHDHLVVGRDGMASFKGLGLM